MPVKRLTSRRPLRPDAQILKDRLVAEWKNPNSSAQQPAILEEAGSDNEPSHIYVIWDEWSDLSQLERSEIVMDAYEEQYGQERSLKVSVAMGLTQTEAERLGIEFR